MTDVRVEPVDRSWTVTKVVAVIVAILSAGYMLPWAIAAVRDVSHWGVFWVNLLLGWTIIGWVIALVMSLRRQRLLLVPHGGDHSARSRGNLTSSAAALAW